jgi:hypothetical protein
MRKKTFHDVIMRLVCAYGVCEAHSYMRELTGILLTYGTLVNQELVCPYTKINIKSYSLSKYVVLVSI